ncbi:hypothetical protein CYR55_09580 [Chimaeribacter californicus]|uniref:Uncharacterized protein n=1 Tax=Chimaeribacter californicus TaxID=2060067 RepID=A0A2N5E8G6_9GAMM|nr:hypothetical protein CYR55_09580 [Chimaeribacter californicus]
MIVEKSIVFKTLITLIIYNLLLPLIILFFGVLWLYVLPQYWWGLMFFTIIAIIWFFPRITKRFEKFK